jgi:DNA-binding NarL/FixJ family response regulator
MNRKGIGVLSMVQKGVYVTAAMDELETAIGVGIDQSQIKVLLADDHPLVIAGIRRTLEQSDDIEIVGEAHSGPELMQLVERRSPDLVLMDLRMPGVVGTECIQRLRESRPELKMVVLSACDDRPSIDGALTAGANAYIVKSVNTSDIASVIRQASGGAVFHAPRGAQPAPQDSGPDLPMLTERERSILSAVAAGMTTATISKDLWVSEHTVKFHLTNIYRKLGVPNRAGAVRFAFEHGLA